MTRRQHEALLHTCICLTLAAMALALSGCTLGRDPGVSRERELVAAQALAEIQQSARAMQDEQLPDAARRAIPRAQEHWAEAGLRALHAEVDDGPR